MADVSTHQAVCGGFNHENSDPVKCPAITVFGQRNQVRLVAKLRQISDAALDKLDPVAYTGWEEAVNGWRCTVPYPIKICSAKKQASRPAKPVRHKEQDTKESENLKNMPKLKPSKSLTQLNKQQSPNNFDFIKKSIRDRKRLERLTSTVARNSTTDGNKSAQSEPKPEIRTEKRGLDTSVYLDFDYPESGGKDSAAVSAWNSHKSKSVSNQFLKRFLDKLPNRSQHVMEEGFPEAFQPVNTFPREVVLDYELCGKQMKSENKRKFSMRHLPSLVLRKASNKIPIDETVSDAEAETLLSVSKVAKRRYLKDAFTNVWSKHLEASEAGDASIGAATLGSQQRGDVVTTSSLQPRVMSGSSGGKLQHDGNKSTSRAVTSREKDTNNNRVKVLNLGDQRGSASDAQQQSSSAFDWKFAPLLPPIVIRRGETKAVKQVEQNATPRLLVNNRLTLGKPAVTNVATITAGKLRAGISSCASISKIDRTNIRHPLPDVSGSKVSAIASLLLHHDVTQDDVAASVPAVVQSK